MNKVTRIKTSISLIQTDIKEKVKLIDLAKQDLQVAEATIHVKTEQIKFLEQEILELKNDINQLEGKNEHKNKKTK